MKIAIVGAEESKWKPEQKKKAKHFIRKLLFMRMLAGHLPVVVSGHCPKGGVDIWAEEIADELGIKKEIYPAEHKGWNDKIIWELEKEIPKNYVVCENPLVSELKQNDLQAMKKDGLKPIANLGTWMDIPHIELMTFHQLKNLGYEGVIVGKQQRDFVSPIKLFEQVRIVKKGYRSRNIQIAKACDVLYDIEPGTDVSSGGTWTMRYAKKLGKKVHLVVIK